MNYENVIEKIYCKSCKWCSKVETVEIEPRKKIHCNHPKNIKINIFENFYEKIESQQFLKKPEERNKNNDCMWHEKQKIKDGGR